MSSEYNGWSTQETHDIYEDMGAEDVIGHYQQRAKGMAIEEIAAAIKREYSEPVDRLHRPSNIYNSLLKTALNNVRWLEIAESIKRASNK